MIRDDPALAARLAVVFVGGPSGLGRHDPDMVTQLAARLGISDVVRLEPPCPQSELADWYRAATVVTVPSYSESFGLVALEAQACGTPVVAASVGGLRTAVRDGESGILVDSHDPADYARVLRQLAASPRTLARLSAGAIQHASGFGWSAAVDRLLGVYTGAMTEARATVEA
jgi:D-inositol-3-phosphate glycosyltransferase